ncbi:MAG: hypothetical protein IT423_24520 [Pirellulaceae bacterium]|nr:hypothetical protein [Pirellulaceae bacterium]
MYTRQILRPSSWTLRAAVRKLARYPEVTHVALGLKERRGRLTALPSLKAHVAEKRSVPHRCKLPRFVQSNDWRGKLQRFRVDVVATGGVPELFGMRSGDHVMGFDRDIGVAGLVFKKGNKCYVLTNAHVVSNVAANQRTGRVFRYHPATGRATVLGEVQYLTRLDPRVVATSDTAVIAVANAALVEPNMVTGLPFPLELMGNIRAQNQYFLSLEGRFLTYVRPEPVAGSPLINVDDVAVRYTGFWQLASADGVAEKGMSGAVLMQRKGNQLVACGLVFGGIADKFLFAYPFEPLFMRAFDSLPQ